MTFAKLNTFLFFIIFLGVISSLCAITTLKIYKENNLGNKISIFISKQ
jgi:hypothetical protein